MATIGDVEMILDNGTKQGGKVRVHNVLYIPGLRFNLFSASKLADKGITAECRAKSLILHRQDGSVLARGSRSEHNWLLNVRKVIQHSQTTILDTETVQVTPRVVTSAERTDAVTKLDRSKPNVMTWHRRLGHPGMKAVAEAASTATGIDIKGLSIPKQPCKPCTIAKAHQNIRRTMPRLRRSTKPGELVHIDVGGGGKLCRSLDGGRYWIASIDDYDSWATVKFLRHKHGAKWAIQEFAKEYERDHETRIESFHSLSDIAQEAIIPGTAAPQVPQRRDSIVAIQSDHGGEFIDMQLQQWAKDRNIARFLSAPYTHQQNGKI
ncbi:hypothetical protein N7532_007976 [Penicillium argentinense]|uniref:Integrase catalytic domain-containing protein n=1 Tax=Penicillium argentinense TaxID=1131581 RepID=A0A9W9EWI6_9EURO|nr:uncharacterized protein N7532_007976 [Penicillium argentinense]KAJ5089292.1 hypothetical protein N7532_007976 [Penicillium argentinense]